MIHYFGRAMQFVSILSNMTKETPLITVLASPRENSHSYSRTIGFVHLFLLRFFFNRTPGPPPISSMNSMPAASPGPKQAGLAEHCGIAGNPANRKR